MFNSSLTIAVPLYNESETIDYMKLSNRDDNQIDLIQKYSEKVGLTRKDCDTAIYSENIELDISILWSWIAFCSKPVLGFLQ